MLITVRKKGKGYIKDIRDVKDIKDMGELEGERKRTKSTQSADKKATKELQLKQGQPVFFFLFAARTLPRTPPGDNSVGGSDARHFVVATDVELHGSMVPCFHPPPTTRHSPETRPGEHIELIPSQLAAIRPSGDQGSGKCSLGALSPTPCPLLPLAPWKGKP